MSKWRQKIGAEGEELAAKYLGKQGYRIIEKNWRCHLGEIDLIAKDADTIVVCEVKTRSNDSFGHPLEAITPKKQTRLRKLGELYCQSLTKTECSLRFDVITIFKDDGVAQLEHIENAF